MLSTLRFQQTPLRFLLLAALLPSLSAIPFEARGQQPTDAQPPGPETQPAPGPGNTFAVPPISPAPTASPTLTQPQPANPTATLTTVRPEISVEHLKLRLKPLTREELVVEADAWRDLLKENVQQIAEVRIRLQSVSETAATTDDADTQFFANQDTNALSEQLVALQEVKTALTARLTAVINELEAKGGEVEAYQQYISALAGVAVDVTDTWSLWTLVRGWAVSKEGGQKWMWNLLKFAVLIILFYFAANIVSSFVRHAAKRIKGTSQLLVDFLSKFVKQAFLAVGLLVGLSALEVNITPLLAALGAAGFVVGFALQDTLGNFASGLLILAYRPFDVGDVIEAAGISGVVDSVSLFSTHVRTFDNKIMIVPNNDIWGGTITNATASDTRRVDLQFGIGYDDNVDTAQQILMSLVEQHPLVLKDPAPAVRLHELGDSSLNFIVRPWTKTSDYWAVYWDLTKQVKAEFDAQGISIPYPQRDVHIHHISSPDAK